MKLRTLTFIAIAIFAAAGCDKLGVAGKSSQGDAPQKIDAKPATDDQAAPSDSTAQSDDQHNAVLEGEDDASKQRRDRAKKSLGLGN
jgi:hypothetical protein